MEILNSTFRSSIKGYIGIALCRLRDGKIQAYIGVVRGHDELSDLQEVAAWGAKLSFAEASAFFPNNNLEESEYKNHKD